MSDIVSNLSSVTQPLSKSSHLDPIITSSAKKQFVLLGEASHGTSEFYTWRAEISKRLIKEKGFRFIAVEGDWPECYRINRYVKGYENNNLTARDILRQSFTRWPTWMWANAEILEFIEWVRVYNDNMPFDEKVGFYGLDVYSMWQSLDAVYDYLQKHEPQALDAATRAFECFQPYGHDIKEYARATALVPESCEKEVHHLLTTLRAEIPTYSEDDKESLFYAQQNALVVSNAERYYRSMLEGGSASWNVRDQHMVEMLTRLVEHHGNDTRALVWAHNTHVGDARATDMKVAGMTNIGQLVREKWGEKYALLIGFGSYEGSVIAADSWQGTPKEMDVPPAAKDSWEDIFHQARADNRFLMLEKVKDHPDFLESRGHRAIGVVYHSKYEAGNYVPTVLPKRYDVFCYINTTKSLYPLTVPVRSEEVPQTYPSGV